MSFFDIVRKHSFAIKNGRTLRSTLKHLRSEVNELDEEIGNGSTGADGIKGESMDIIACALDIIFQHDPNVTKKELDEILEKKCVKWAEKYKDFQA